MTLLPFTWTEQALAKAGFVARATWTCSSCGAEVTRYENVHRNKKLFLTEDMDVHEYPCTGGEPDEE